MSNFDIEHFMVYLECRIFFKANDKEAIALPSTLRCSLSKE